MPVCLTQCFPTFLLWGSIGIAKNLLDPIKVDMYSTDPLNAKFEKDAFLIFTLFVSAHD